MLDRLRRDQDHIRERMKQVDVDHIDGKIDVDLFNRITEDFRDDQRSLARELDRLATADEAYVDDDIALLGIANDARRVLAEVSFASKRNILSHLLSNCTNKDGEVDVTFRKPFDIIVERLPREELAGTGFGAKMPKSRKWLPGW